MGNIFGRWEGSRKGAGAVLTGSHCDAIPLAGGRAVGRGVHVERDETV